MKIISLISKRYRLHPGTSADTYKLTELHWHHGWKFPFCPKQESVKEYFFKKLLFLGGSFCTAVENYSELLVADGLQSGDKKCEPSAPTFVLCSVTRLGEILPFGRIFCALGEIFFRSLFTIGRFFGQNFIYFGRIFFQVYLLLGEIFQRFGRIFFLTVWSHWSYEQLFTISLRKPQIGSKYDSRSKLSLPRWGAVDEWSTALPVRENKRKPKDHRFLPGPGLGKLWKKHSTADYGKAAEFLRMYD